MNYNYANKYFKSLINFKTDYKILYNDIINFQNTHLIPAIDYDTAIFLNFIASLNQPKNILEIGFGSGVSSFFIFKNLTCISNFISLERDKNRFNRGENLLKKYKNNTIKLINVDAFEYLKKNKLYFDFIFLDAVKREYIKYLEPIKLILKKNGILICDNILFNGMIIKKKIEKKYENGVEYLKLFNNTLINDIELNTTFLLIGDGLSISIKNN